MLASIKVKLPDMRYTHRISDQNPHIYSQKRTTEKSSFYGKICL